MEIYILLLLPEGVAKRKQKRNISITHFRQKLFYGLRHFTYSNCKLTTTTSQYQSVYL